MYGPFDFSLVFGVYFFLVGIAAGSFLNVVILRGERGESLGGRSRCEQCKKTLSLFELIPILSFLIQKGRCRRCSVRISWQYPLVELGTGILFGFSGWFWFSHAPLNLETFILITGIFLVLSSAIVIFVSDLKFYSIPNGAAVALILLGIIASLARNKIILSSSSSLSLLLPLPLSSSLSSSLSRDFIAALLFSLFFAALWLVSKGKWMGLGDAKLFFAVALLIGFPLSLAAFLFSFWLGALAALILLFLGKKRTKDIMPFGPFILIGTVLALFWGSGFIQMSGLYEIFYLLSF